jgi:FMN-dependent oxidoreductase (nitrilotriacetate monooxygenase family)
MTSADPFRLGWFGNLTTPDWKTPYAGDDPLTWTDGRFHIDMVRNMERAGFDFLMLEDSAMVPDIYNGTAELELKHARYAPKLDPVVTSSMLAYATEHIGIVATASTSFYSPWHLARQFSTLDHITRGRIGWNIVTSSEDRAAQNYGMAALPAHDQRYEIAEEFVDAAFQLWDSWDPDAIVADPETGYYADFRKVHPIDFEGTHFRTRGPLNTPYSPQGRPVICQAGGSPRGRDFAARNADMVLNIPNGIDGMKAFRDDMRERVVKAGRDADSVKCFFVIYPIIAESERAAQEKNEAWYARKQHNFEVQMAHFAATMEIDFSQFDVDQPMPEDLSTNGHQSRLEQYRQAFGGRTIREAASAMRVGSLPLVGTPDSVAAQLDEAMQEVGGDGFLIYGQPISRAFVAEMTDGLAPALRKRNLLRSHYSRPTFRENLMSF